MLVGGWRRKMLGRGRLERGKSKRSPLDPQQCRIGERAPGRYDCFGKFGEEEWRLTIWIGAHLAGVRGIVPADTENAADREAFVRSRNC